MGNKKDETRFSIKFNPTYPRHQEAIRILNEAGRGKAALIADVLHMYSRSGVRLGGDSPRNPPISHHPSSLTAHESPGKDYETEDDIWQTIDESVDSFFGQ